MILSGKEILKRLGGDIKITPFDTRCLNPNSYNVHLADEIVEYSHKVIDMAANNQSTHSTIPKSGMVLHPGHIYLARTVEYTETRNLIPMIEGRSGCGRLGLFIHATAGFGDIGFCGYWTLELSVVQPLIVYPGVEIAQLFYHTVEGEYDNSEYRGSYQANTGIQTSQMFNKVRSMLDTSPTLPFDDR